MNLHTHRFLSYASFKRIQASIVLGDSVGVVEYKGKRIDNIVSTGVSSAVLILILNLTFAFDEFGGSSLFPSRYLVGMSSTSTVSIGQPKFIVVTAA